MKVWAFGNLLKSKKGQGITAIAAIIAIILGIGVIMLIAFYFQQTSSKGIGGTSKGIECDTLKSRYCNSLIHGGVVVNWDESCGGLPSESECAVYTGGLEVKCEPGATKSCTKRCKGCVGDVCRSQGKSTTGTQTCQADETWGECDAAPCIDECTDDLHCQGTECIDSMECSGEENSCECIAGRCKDCSDYYGMDCGASICKDSEKPAEWSCIFDVEAVEFGEERFYCLPACEEHEDCKEDTIDCEDYQDHFCRDVCNPGELEVENLICKGEQICCLTGPPSPQ